MERHIIAHKKASKDISLKGTKKNIMLIDDNNSINVPYHIYLNIHCLLFVKSVDIIESSLSNITNK